jgi:hypothetical protein
MRLAAPIVALTCAFAPLSVAAQPAGQVSKAALAAAGRQATLKSIDYGSDYCDGEMTVEAWLKALVGKQARSITWTGGDCVLVSDMRPGIDASEWPYCAQATVALVDPKKKKDTPLVEIYLEKPEHGRPGKAYAFRGTMETRDGGPDYIRFRKDFEGLWDERFPPAPEAARCKND